MASRLRPKYPMTRDTEALISLAEVTFPRFHEVVGHALEADRMPHDDARVLIEAAHAIARTTGAPCSSAIAALQHLRYTVNQGKLTMEEVEAASALLDLAEDIGGIPDLDALINSLIPIIRDVLYQASLELSLKDMGKGSSCDAAEDAAERFSQVVRLGTARMSLGASLMGTAEDIGLSCVSTIRDPLATGIAELDLALNGGLERGALGLLLGGSGDGKSLFLAHVAAESVFCGYNVAWVTLELSEDAVKQRLYANLVGMTVDEMAAAPAEAVRRFTALRAQGAAGFRVVYMTPSASTVAMVKTWLKDLEREREFHTDVLIVDYLDKLVATTSSTKRPQSSYEEMKVCTEALRNINVERDGWLWTASQTGGREGHKKKVGLEDVSDSMHKVRIADLVLAIARTDDDCTNGMTRFCIPKRRNWEAHGEVGPLPMDAIHWRMVPTNRNEPW